MAAFMVRTMAADNMLAGVVPGLAVMMRFLGKSRIGKAENRRQKNNKSIKFTAHDTPFLV